MICRKINESLKQLLSEEGKDYKHAEQLGYSTAQDFKVGDKVRLIGTKRPGVISKQIAVDVYEIEFPEWGSNMARTDRFYANDLELVKDVNEEMLRTYKVNLEVQVPANVNNIEVEHEVERVILEHLGKFGDDVLDIEVERI